MASVDRVQVAVKECVFASYTQPESLSMHNGEGDSGMSQQSVKLFQELIQEQDQEIASLKTSNLAIAAEVSLMFFTCCALAYVASHVSNLAVGILP